MVGQQALNAYRSTEKQTEIHPVRLVHMLYERVLMHLELAEAGVKENSPKKRGENLGKAIAIITELNASIKTEDTSDAAEFLRGLYGAMLVELPKVAVSGDVSILKRAHKYIHQLKEIWEQTAMVEHGLMDNAPDKTKVRPEGGYSSSSFPAGKEDDVPAGLSVSI
jgi:flagellar protein FliS